MSGFHYLYALNLTSQLALKLCDLIGRALLGFL